MKINIVPDFKLECPHCGNEISKVDILTDTFLFQCPYCSQFIHLLIRLLKNYLAPSVPLE